MVSTITETTAASGNGNNTISQNRITGSVFLRGNTGGTATNDVVTFNTFTGSASLLLTVSNDAGLLIQSNTFIGEGDFQTAIDLGSSGTQAAPVVIANNTISMSGGNNNRVGIGLGGTNPTFVRVLNNTINTGNLGLGLSLFGATNQNTLTVLVQGNDFHGNKIGVSYQGVGAGVSAIVLADLGGGNLGSLGGNDFRSFATQGNTTLAAILMTGTALGATLPAHNNIFLGTITPDNVIDDRNSGAGTGTGDVDVSSPLSGNRSFVQALYNNTLGRSGSLAELDNWVSPSTTLNPESRAAVANGILRSREALGRIIDGYYLQYLGRQSDPGREGWINLLQSGARQEDVQAIFLSTPEFLSHINTDYVQALYLLTLHRTGNSAELASWYSVLPSLGLRGVAAAFTTSAENRYHEVADDFQRLLHRPASAGDLSSFAGSPADLLTLEAAVLSSGEFFTNG